MSILPTKDFRILNSSWTLIASNLIILALALTYNWSLLSIVMAFLIENIFIGIFSIPKIFLAKKKQPGHRPDTIGSKIMLLFVFLFCYIIFLLLHLFLTVSMFGNMQDAFTPIETIMKQLNVFYIIGLSGIFLSHCFSFFYNFIKKHEFENHSPFMMMLGPFKRVFLIHGFIFLGGYIILFFEQGQTILLVIFIAIKTLLDLAAHQKEHTLKSK